MNQLLELMTGKDWVITITIPNGSLRNFPEEVNTLQNTIQLALLKFNSDVKATEKEQAIIKKLNLIKENSTISDVERNVVIARMEEERKKRNQGR